MKIFLDRDTIACWQRRIAVEPSTPLRWDQLLWVDPEKQSLNLFVNGGLRGQWPVSTALNGIDNRDGSGGTPPGLHRVSQKIGAGAPVGEVFVGRIDKGYSLLSPEALPAGAKEWITTRILRLAGLEPGVNSGPAIDSWDRLIYIHGTSEESDIGEAVSSGCVRMKNDDVMELFDLVDVGALVYIGDLDGCAAERAGP